MNSYYTFGPSNLNVMSIGIMVNGVGLSFTYKMHILRDLSLRKSGEVIAGRTIHVNWD